jgi:23S rRNA (adenine2503-C2)-methyltransferase
MQDFFNLTLQELEGALGALGNEKYRAKQLFQWIYHKGVLDFSEMSNVPKSLRSIFQSMFGLSNLTVQEALTSSDGSIKFAFSTADGYTIESVLMPEAEKERNTLCVSTQIGCRMGCRFCVTGKIGFKRNLSAGEIVGQVTAVKRHINNERINNIVVMGMGEPIDNLENLLKALDIVKDPLGLNVSYRRITVSSVGLIDGLNTIQPRVAALAISLNAADDKKRTYLMPINRLYPIREVINFVKGFQGAKRMRITFEYVLLKGVNDTLEDAKHLAEILAGVRCKINLIPFNESPYLEFKAPEPASVQRFQEYLLNKRFIAIVRDSRGTDIHGGCGQLGAKYLEL